MIASNSRKTLLQNFLTLKKISTDTRSIDQGSIFFALKGAHFNGNTFALKALDMGAAIAVVDDPSLPDNDKLVKVDDVLVAMQNLATDYRSTLTATVIALTGSNGKTTTKELLSRVLAAAFKVHATKGNLNNHIGVPITLLTAPSDADFVIVEMGANHQQEIALLAKITMPDAGFINNVGLAHIEGFGGFEGVKKGKGELYDHLKEHNQLVFVNGDNPHLSAMLQERNLSAVSYGSNPRFEAVGKIAIEQPFLTVAWQDGGHEWMIHSKLTGAYNFENIMAAVCIGKYYEVKPASIVAAISTYEPDNSRSQVIKKGNHTIILDAYNANPTSMQAALLNLQALEATHKVVFLGQMAELGTQSLEEHQKIVDVLENMQLYKAILVGEYFSACKIPSHFIVTNDSKTAANYFTALPLTALTILIKGSRSSKMEWVLG
jgi:UDP-N-acetylmuramoyl-tripeptide--D-alanyl-D-alanine ligase